LNAPCFGVSGGHDRIAGNQRIATAGIRIA
jgi:hypothetical protein